MKRDYPDVGLHVPTLLLPRADVPKETWAVVACDQYTSQPEYWRRTRELVGDQPSTLHLVLPEAQLGTTDRDAAVAAINRRMADYLSAGVLAEQPPGFMLVEREVGRSSPRRGLLVALDLEHFDYATGAQTLVRSTEGTDPSRLPARVAVRRDAPLETPHVLVLIDDPQRTVIEPLFDLPLPLAYDFALMQGGGRVCGWHIGEGAAIDRIAEALAGLRQGEPPLLYAMGDGNHSLAAARAVWAELKASGAAPDHPGRYALVELVNVYDLALEFEPIHRLVDCEPAPLLAAMAEHFADAGFVCHEFGEREDWLAARRESVTDARHVLPFMAAARYGVATIRKPRHKLATATLQTFLDRFRAERPGVALDYIHGDETLMALANAPGRVGFLLPAMDKHDLFKTVASEGATPPKTFSLGEAHEKRYYLECRRIRPPAPSADLS